MTHILVTGGAGYIGSHFVRMCLSRFPDRTVLVVDNLSEGHVESLPISSNLLFVEADTGNVSVMSSLMKRHSVDAVVHFAASCYVGESEKDPNKYLHNNVTNSLSLFSAMEHSGVNKIVYSSSCAVYGYPQSLPLNEAHPLAPINVYGMTKHLVEQALSAVSRCLGWSYIALRYFNAAGTDREATIGELHNPETHLIPLVLQAANEKRDYVEIYGDDYDTPDGTCIRDYVHVNDLSDAHCRALELLGASNVREAINLGTESGASVKEIIDTCKQVSGRDIPLRYAPRRQGDPPMLVANSEKARKLLGWQPGHSLRDTIASAWDWELRRP